jgi:hypothetical protein
MQVGEEGELNLRGKKNRSPIVIGEVVGIHIDDKLITDGIVDITKVRPIARLGYVDYSVVNEVFGIMRRASPEAAIAASKKGTISPRHPRRMIGHWPSPFEGRCAATSG